MSQEATETTTKIETVTAEESQTSEGQGVDQQTETIKEESGQAKVGNQPPPMIPKPRFDEVLQRMHQAEAELRSLKQPKQEAPKDSPVGDPKPKASDFQTADEYVEALGAWSANKEFARLKQEEAQSKVREKVQSKVVEADANWANQVHEATSKYPDFTEVITMAPRINDAALFVMKKSPIAGDLAYHLGKNPKIVHELNDMHPLEAAAELARIEAKLHGSTGQPKIKPSAKIPSIEPPSGGRKQGSTRSGDDLTVDDVIGRLYPH